MSCASCLVPRSLTPSTPPLASHFLYHGCPARPSRDQSGLFLEQTLGPWYQSFFVHSFSLRYPHGLVGLSTVIPLNVSTFVTWRDICAFLLLPAFRFHSHSHSHRKRSCRSFKSLEDAKGVILCPSAHYSDHSTHSRLNSTELGGQPSGFFIQLVH